MNEILIIRRYRLSDVVCKGDYDVELILNNVSIRYGNDYQMEPYIAGFIEAINQTNTFHSLREQNVNSIEDYDEGK